MAALYFPSTRRFSDIPLPPASAVSVARLRGRVRSTSRPVRREAGRIAVVVVSGIEHACIEREGSRRMDDDHDKAPRRSVVGGRHGSPTITIALPFSRISGADADLRDAVAELATLLARLAPHVGDDAEAKAVRKAAERLAARLAEGG
jgi:hypothetical protein